MYLTHHWSKPLLHKPCTLLNTVFGQVMPQNTGLTNEIIQSSLEGVQNLLSKKDKCTVRKVSLLQTVLQRVSGEVSLVKQQGSTGRKTPQRQRKAHGECKGWVQGPRGQWKGKQRTHHYVLQQKPWKNQVQPRVGTFNTDRRGERNNQTLTFWRTPGLIIECITGTETQGKNTSYRDQENYFKNLGALVKRTECQYFLK